MEQAYVYGIDDLYNKWELLLTEVKKKKISEGRDYYEDNYYTAFAVVLLSWYGVSVENMILIQKDDVSADGIRGYENISFDKRTIDFFMMYANTDFIHRNKNFGIEKALYTQPTLIRTTEDMPVTYQTVADMFSKVRFPLPKESEWLKKLFTPNQVSLAGQYDRIYQYGKSVGVNFADTNRNKNITQDMILHISDIFHYSYDSQKKASFVAKLKYYSSRYYYPRIEWESVNDGATLLDSETKLSSDMENCRSDKLKSSIRQNNQDILIRKLSVKIDAMQRELLEIKELLNLLNSND